MGCQLVTMNFHRRARIEYGMNSNTKALFTHKAEFSRVPRGMCVCVCVCVCVWKCGSVGVADREKKEKSVNPFF